MYNAQQLYTDSSAQAFAGTALARAAMWVFDRASGWLVVLLLLLVLVVVDRVSQAPDLAHGSGVTAAIWLWSAVMFVVVGAVTH